MPRFFRHLRGVNATKGDFLLGELVDEAISTGKYLHIKPKNESLYNFLLITPEGEVFVSTSSWKRQLIPSPQDEAGKEALRLLGLLQNNGAEKEIK